MALEQDVRAYVREIENVLANPKTNEELCLSLQNICSLLPATLLSSDRFSKNDLAAARRIFVKNHYAKFGDFLIKHLSVEFMSRIQNEKTRLLLDSYFLNGNHCDSFILLCNSIQASKLSFSTNKCISLLEEFLKKNLVELIWEQCHVCSSQDKSISFIWDHLLTTLASIPDRLTNKLKQQTSEIFYPDFYIAMVARNILVVLQRTYEALQSGKDCSLEFVSRLIGKLCLVGYSDLLWKNLLPQLSCYIRRDFLWSRMAERVIVGVPDSTTESVLVPLLKTLTWHGLVAKFLGDSVMDIQRIQYLLCTKLLFYRHSENIILMQNIIGYLTSSENRKQFFKKVFIELLTVWGDSSAIKHTPYEQHLYITKAVIISIGQMKDKEKEEWKDDLLKLLMPGVQNHISSADVHVRKLGMLVAELLTQAIDADGPGLKFEYEKDEEVKSLMSLLVLPDDPGVSEVESAMESSNIIDADDRSGREEKLPECSTRNDDSDLDSDDDLVPYDMSNDTKMSKVKSPKFLRDCMEGLICSDDPDKVEASLFVAESLIRSSVDGIDEIAEEFTKILLHLSDNFSTPGFITLRFGAMVGLAVKSPIKVSEYLTKQFYDRNYNLRQRMDILQVIGAAAQELSKPLDITHKELKEQPMIVEIDTGANTTESWKDVVQKRIESKTRRFAHGRTQPEPVAVANKFGNVAGHFFYPFLKSYDRKENTFDLLGEDCVLLERLLYTLGIVLYSAIHTLNLKQMGATLLEFVWVLRFHKDQNVRQSLLFCVSIIFLSVPGHFLLMDLQSEVSETKSWLEDVIEKDANKDCRKLAAQSLLLLESVVKQVCRVLCQSGRMKEQKKGYILLLKPYLVNLSDMGPVNIIEFSLF